MSFSPIWTREALSTYGDLKREAEQARASRLKTKKRKASKQEGLFKQVNKCIQNLLQNPRHPGLNTHEFFGIDDPYNESGKRKKKVLEAYAQNDSPRAYRVMWCYGPHKRQITLIAIVPHPEKG